MTRALKSILVVALTLVIAFAIASWLLPDGWLLDIIRKF